VPRNGVQLARFGADLYEQHFPDPADRQAALARPFYEACLEVLPESWQVDLAFAARQGGLKGGRAKAALLWTRSEADVDRMLALAVAPLREAMHPAPIKVDPFPVVASQQEGISA
jgi:hypothetical protein